MPPGSVQTVGFNPTKLNVPAGGLANDIDGYFIPNFPRGCRGMGIDKLIEITAFRNNRPLSLKGFATIDAIMNPPSLGWRSKGFKKEANETGADKIEPKAGVSRKSTGKRKHQGWTGQNEERATESAEKIPRHPGSRRLASHWMQKTSCANL